LFFLDEQLAACALISLVFELEQVTQHGARSFVVLFVESKYAAHYFERRNKGITHRDPDDRKQHLGIPGHQTKGCVGRRFVLLSSARLILLIFTSACPCLLVVPCFVLYAFGHRPILNLT
jgi:hypothetical protein